MNEDMWEITEMLSGAWWVQKEGTRRSDDETLVCGGLTKEQAMYHAAASGRVLDLEGYRLQRWEVPK